jgi:nucleotide-binding universal stress UspA family protein
MFKHILVPTDGSALSASMLGKVMAFAHDSGASVTVIHVREEFQVFTVQPAMLADTREQYARDSVAAGQRILEQAQLLAKETRVTCDTMLAEGEHPYEVIIQASRERGCDLICMASHGRRGVQALLLGSETQKVLTHSDIPVLVYR